MMYVHNNLNFFQPEVYNQHGAGKTVAEFPIIYYLDACIISLVGVQHKDFVIRLINLLIFYLGLFYLFKMVMLFIPNRWIAILPVVLLHSFPIVAYYASTSVPNVPAMSFVIIGIYFLFRFITDKRQKYFAIAMLMVALCGMIKMTALIPYLSICAVLFLGTITKNEKFKIPVRNLLLLAVPVIISLIWVKIASNYNAANDNITFLLSTKPIWKLERSFIDNISHRMQTSWIYDYIFIPLMWWTLAGALFFVIKASKKLNLLKIGLGILLIGSAAYMYLFFEQFYHHDYYAIELLPLVLTFFIVGLYAVIQMDANSKIRKALIIITTLLILGNIPYTGANMIKRYTEGASHNAAYDDYFELKKSLRANGINFEDKVVVASDNSPNISLYFMDQLGWTRFPYGFDEEKLSSYIDEGAKYLIIRKVDSNNNSNIVEHFEKLIIEDDKFLVFKLRQKTEH